MVSGDILNPLDNCRTIVCLSPMSMSLKARNASTDVDVPNVAVTNTRQTMHVRHITTPFVPSMRSPTNI